MNPCADKGFLREPLRNKKKVSGAAQAYQTNPPSGSCWEFKTITDHTVIRLHRMVRKRPHSNRRTKQDSGNTSEKVSCGFFLYRYRLHEQDAG